MKNGVYSILIIKPGFETKTLYFSKYILILYIYFNIKKLIKQFYKIVYINFIYKLLKKKIK